MKRLFSPVCLLCLLFGCTRSVILMSPEDHFALGNYYLDESEFGKAGEQFEQIRDRYPSSEYATMSQFKLAVTRFQNKKYDEAALDFDLFLEFHPAHKLAPFAQYHLALSKYESRLIPDRDPTIAQEALLEFDTFIGMYPDHENHLDAIKFRDELKDHLLEHDLEAGLVYYRLGIYPAAIQRIESVAEKAHDHLLLARAAYYLGRSNYHKDDFSAAIHAFEQSANADPLSKWARKSNKWLAKSKHAAEVHQETTTP